MSEKYLNFHLCSELIKTSQLLLAPYLSDDTMANISKKITSSNIKDFVALAPYMPDEALNDVVTRMEYDNFDGVTALAPFLSKK